MTTALKLSHKEAITNLGFVSEYRPADELDHQGWFIPGDQFNKVTTLRVDIQADETTLHVFNEPHKMWAYSVRFTSGTPWTVVNQAVAAAMQIL